MSPIVSFSVNNVVAKNIFSAFLSLCLLSIIIFSFSNSFLKNKSLNTGCEISCICVDITGSKLPVTSKICSLFPIFLIYKFRISIGSSTSTVVFAVISISPSCLTIFVLSGENTVLYLSGLSKKLA